MTGCFGTPSSATSSRVRVPSHPAPRGDPGPALALQARPRDPSWLGLLALSSVQGSGSGGSAPGNPLSLLSPSEELPAKPGWPLTLSHPARAHGLQQVGEPWMLQRAAHSHRGVGSSRDSLISAHGAISAAAGCTQPRCSALLPPVPEDAALAQNHSPSLPLHLGNVNLGLPGAHNQPRNPLHSCWESTTDLSSSQG